MVFARRTFLIAGHYGLIALLPMYFLEGRTLPISARAPPTAPSLAASTRGLVGWVCTSNPFYVLSALLVWLGLWVSFGAQDHAARDLGPDGRHGRLHAAAGASPPACSCGSSASGTTCAPSCCWSC